MAKYTSRNLIDMDIKFLKQNIALVSGGYKDPCNPCQQQLVTDEDITWILTLTTGDKIQITDEMKTFIETIDAFGEIKMHVILLNQRKGISTMMATSINLDEDGYYNNTIGCYTPHVDSTFENNEDEDANMNEEGVNNPTTFYMMGVDDGNIHQRIKLPDDRIYPQYMTRGGIDETYISNGYYPSEQINARVNDDGDLVYDTRYFYSAISKLPNRILTELGTIFNLRTEEYISGEIDGDTLKVQSSKTIVGCDGYKIAWGAYLVMYYRELEGTEYKHKSVTLDITDEDVLNKLKTAFMKAYNDTPILKDIQNIREYEHATNVN